MTLRVTANLLRVCRVMFTDPGPHQPLNLARQAKVSPGSIYALLARMQSAGLTSAQEQEGGQATYWMPPEARERVSKLLELDPVGPTLERQLPAIVVEVRLSGMDVRRTVALPSSAHLGDLHHAIQGVMGWWNIHLHRFTLLDQGRQYDYEDPQDPDCDLTLCHDERLLRLDVAESRLNARDYAAEFLGAAPASRTLTYEYDFGDCWRCTLNLSRRQLAPAQLWRCLDASGTAPCEDSGGVEDYRAKVARASKDARIRKWFAFMRHDPQAAVSAETADLAWENYRLGKTGPAEDTHSP